MFASSPAELMVWMTDGMTLSDLTALIGAMTALVIAVTGALTAIKVLREVKIGNDKTDAVEQQLKVVKRTTARTAKNQHDLLTTLHLENLEDPDNPRKDGPPDAVRKTPEW